MGRLIKSDFYKVLHSKYLYICAAVMIALSVGFIGLIYLGTASVGGEEYALLFGFTSKQALSAGLLFVQLFVSIAMLIFVTEDFRRGTIKNIVSSGVSRISIYFSKIIVSISILVSYTLISMGISFTMGSILWEVGEYTREDLINILQAIGIYLLAEIATITLSIMIAFLLRNTLGTFVVVFCWPTIFSMFTSALSSLMPLKSAIQEFPKYLPSTYSYQAMALVPPSDMTMALVVPGAYILICTIIGIITFKLRDIKK